MISGENVLLQSDNYSQSDSDLGDRQSNVVHHEGRTFSGAVNHMEVAILSSSMKKSNETIVEPAEYSCVDSDTEIPIKDRNRK